jgi:hypothetical protein
MGHRYFSATALAGKLYVQGIGERESWDSERLAYLGTARTWTESSSHYQT